MAAPIYAGGLLSDSVSDVRMNARLPEVSASASQYSNANIAKMLVDALDQITGEVYASGKPVPYATCEVRLEAERSMYLLPPGILELHAVKVYDSNQVLTAELLTRPRTSPWGIGYGMEGSRWLKLTDTPARLGFPTDVLTVEYVPGGRLGWHQNAAPIWSADNEAGTRLLRESTFRPNLVSNAWTLGELDKRPGAYIGSTLRVLGTVSGDALEGFNGVFPVQERKCREGRFEFATGTILTAVSAANGKTTITATASVFGAGYAGLALVMSSGTRYVIASYTSGTEVVVWGDATAETGTFAVQGGPGDVSFDPDLDFDTRALDDKVILQAEAVGRTYLVYEVVPDVDRALVEVASLSVASRLNDLCGRHEFAAALLARSNRRLRTAQLAWANRDMAQPMAWDTSRFDFDQDVRGYYP